MLRGIERDLHDATQMRLAALAMALGRIKVGLDESTDADLVHIRSLVDTAHRDTKETIVELRNLAPRSFARS